MKAKEIQAAITANGGNPVEVYYCHESYDFKANRENPDECRWTTDGTLYFKTYAAKMEPASHGLRGTHLKLTRPRPDHLKPDVLYFSVRYVILAQVVGLYADIAPGRREAVQAERTRRERSRQQALTAERERAELVARAASLGYPPTGSNVTRAGRVAQLTFSAKQMRALLDEIEQVRYGEAQTHVRGGF